MADHARPRQERCGLTSAELSSWSRTCAYEGVELDARFAAIRARYESASEAPTEREQATDHWARQLAITCAGLFVVIAVVLMIGGHS